MLEEARLKEEKERGPERGSWNEDHAEKEAKAAKEAKDRLLLPTAPQWTLTYMLQARDDPSALVPAAAVAGAWPC